MKSGPILPLLLFHLCISICLGNPGHQVMQSQVRKHAPKKVIQHNRPHPTFNQPPRQGIDPLSPEASALPVPQIISRPQSTNPVPSLSAPVDHQSDHRSSDMTDGSAPQPKLGVFPYSGTGGTGSPFSAPTGQSASQVSPLLVNADPELSMDSTPAGSLIARIHGNGILGYVLFTPDSTGSGRTVIRARLTGSSERKESYNWKVHAFPQQANALGCSSITTGQMLFDLSAAHGQLSPDKDVVISSTAINLFAEESHLNILGRTLVVHGMNTGALVCATILPAGKKKLYEAKFHHPISGSVRLMQTQTATGVLTEYMMYSDGSRLTSVHTWNIVQGTASDAELGNKYSLESSRCASLNPSGGSLLSRNQAAPIPVSTEMPGVKGRSYQVVPNLRSMETSPVNFLVIFEEDEPTKVLACAPLNQIKSKRAVAKFSTDPEAAVQGTITFTQETPFDPTKIESNLKLNTKAYSYGIDLLPTIRRRRNEPKSCPNIKETIYNPFFKDPEEIPPEGAGTTDQFAVGDLSGKFGSLSGKDQEIFTSYDFNLPLYGQFSVVGRAIVIYAPDGPAISCTNIELDMGTNVTTAYATFDIPLQGQFIFRQLTGECSSEAYVYIEISKPDGPDNQKTLNHPWHVHEKSVNAGYEHLSAMKEDCAIAGKHLNPFNVSTDCIYQRDCTMFTPHRCEVGDSSGKLGPIDVPTYKSGPGGEPDVGKYYFIDTDLSLCGPTSIIGRSVVIHEKNFGAKRLTCANILEFKPRNNSQSRA